MQNRMPLAALVAALALPVLAADPDANVGNPKPAATGGENVRAAYLGVATSPLDETLGEHLGLPAGIGLLVAFVDTNSPARGIVEVHDVLHKLNDQLLVDQRQLAVLIRTLKPGDTVTLTLYRKGKPAVVTAQLRERELPRLPVASWHMPPLQLMPPSMGAGFPSFPRVEDMHRRMQEMLRSSGIQDERLQQMMNDMDELWTGMPGAPLPGSSTSSINISGQSASATTRADNDHVLTVTTDQDGKRSVKATDREGKVLFEGPVNTEDELKNVPESVREKVDEMLEPSHGMSLPAPASPATGPIF